MNIRYTRRAARDLEAILSYISGRSPKGAANVDAALQNSLRFLAEHPRAGKRTAEPALFVLIVPNYPYKMFYRIGDKTIDLIHIRHSARRVWREG